MHTDGYGHGHGHGHGAGIDGASGRIWSDFFFSFFFFLFFRLSKFFHRHLHLGQKYQFGGGRKKKKKRGREKGGGEGGEGGVEKRRTGTQKEILGHEAAALCKLVFSSRPHIRTCVRVPMTMFFPVFVGCFFPCSRIFFVFFVFCVLCFCLF